MAAYVVMFLGIPRSAENDETITRCPASCARKIAAAASVWASAPMKLVSAVSLLASKRPVPSGWPLPRPALTTTRSMAAELVAELVEHPEDGVVVVDVERLDGDAAVGVGGGDLGGELVEAVRTTRAEGEVVASRGELAGHLGPEPAAGTGDEGRRHGES